MPIMDVATPVKSLAPIRFSIRPQIEADYQVNYVYRYLVAFFAKVWFQYFCNLFFCRWQQQKRRRQWKLDQNCSKKRQKNS